MEPSQAQVDVIVRHLRPVRFDAASPIYEVGRACTDMVLMSTGLVRAYYVHADREINLRLLCAPSVAVSMRSLITREPADECVEAITEVHGFRADLRGLEGEASDLAAFVGRVMAEQHYLSLDRRLRMLQHKSVAERHAYFREHMEPDIVALTPGYHVASYLGVAPETLSRVRGGRS